MSTSLEGKHLHAADTHKLHKRVLLLIVIHSIL